MWYSQLAPRVLRCGKITCQQLTTAVLLAGMVSGGGAEAQWTAPPEFAIDFDHLSAYPYELITLGQQGPPGYPNKYDVSLVNDSGALQRAINDVNLAGGGTVIVPPGTYQFINVSLKSNVHLVFDNCTLVPYTANQPDTNNFTMFNLGNSGKIEDVSIRSRSGARSDFELWNPNFPNKRYNLQAISCKDVDNFLIQNFQFWDISASPSNKASVGLYWRPNTDTPFPNSEAIPHNGTINQLTSKGAHYGFGTLQVNTGRNIVFSNIDCQGGVALRLESDALQIVRVGAGGMFNLNATNIISRKGQSAVKVWPHARLKTKPNHGALVIDGVTSYGSELALEIADDSTNNVSDEPNPNLYEANRHTSITVSNVTAFYSSAQRTTQWKHLKFYHPDLYTDNPPATEDLVDRQE